MRWNRHKPFVVGALFGLVEQHRLEALSYPDLYVAYACSHATVRNVLFWRDYNTLSWRRRAFVRSVQSLRVHDERNLSKYSSERRNGPHRDATG